MILLEGPDGGGKTTLLNQLVEQWQLPVMPRFADTHGPKHDLYRLVYEDQIGRGNQKCSIYDRHPLVSEYIYGSVLGRGIRTEFLGSSAKMMRQQLASDCLVILCLPPFETVHQNVANSEQMEGVFEDIDRIYEQYELLKITWPGTIITHDYTLPSSPVWTRVPLHVTDWNRGK